MPRKTRKTHYKSLSLTDKSEEILDIYVKEKDYLSASEAVRHCIQFSYDKEFPNYVFKTTPAGEMKKRKLDEIKTFEQMSPEDYVFSLGGIIRTSQEGVPWALFHQMGNSIKGFLVESIKDLADDEGFQGFIEYHKGVLEEKTIEEVMTKPIIQSNLLQEYDILISDDQNKRDDDSNTRLPVIEENFSVAPERPADSGDPERTTDSLPAGEQSGIAGHSGDNAPERPNDPDRGKDGPRQTEASTDSLSGAIEKLKSHGPSGS